MGVWACGRVWVCVCGGGGWEGGCICVGVGMGGHAYMHVFVHACMTDKIKLLVSTVHSVAVGAQCPLDKQQ